MMDHIAVIILAAGEGTRMKARTKNKVAYKLAGRPMITYPVDAIKKAGIQMVVVVVKFFDGSVRDALGNTVIYSTQGDKKGTAAALESGLTRIPKDVTDVLVMYGDDSAFYTPDLFRYVVSEHRRHNADVTAVSIIVDEPTGLGRIVRDEYGEVVRIVEEKNATEAEKRINEINTGLYCFRRTFVEQGISNIEMNPVSGEYYLTDIVEICQRQGNRLHVCLYPDSTIWFGVNTRSQWARAKQFISKKSDEIELSDQG